MAQRIKKQFFRILPVSVVILLVIITGVGLLNSIAGVQPVKAVVGDGASSNIQLLDTIANGKIDRITFDIANPNLETWSLTGAAPHGLSVTQSGNDITISAVSITTAPNANPVSIQVDLSEADTDLLVNSNGVTSGIMELIYTQATYGVTPNIQDSLDEELIAIAAVDTDATNTEIDGAAPIALTYVFKDTEPDGTVNRVDITYSEAMQVAYEAGDWSFPTAGSIGLWSVSAATASGSDVRLTTPANANITGGITLPTLSYNAAAVTANSVSDLATVPNPAASIAGATIADGAAPYPRSAVYEDFIPDGIIDRINLLMTTDRTLSCGNEAGDWSFPTPGTVNLSAPAGCSVVGNNIFIAVGSAEANTTGGITNPTVSYADLGTLGSVRDSALIPNATLAFGPMTATDNAEPMMFDASYIDFDADGSVDRIRTTWSENVNMTGSTSADWIIGAGDINAVYAVTPDDAGGDPNVDIYVTADADETGSATSVTIQYIAANGIILDEGFSTLYPTVDSATITATDGAEPVVLSAIPSVSTISDAIVGSDTFWVDITYTEPMNALSTPILSYTPDLGASGDLVLSGNSTWTSATTYRTFYNVVDNNVETTITAVDITSAMDVPGNTQVDYNFLGAAGLVDTENPSLTSVTIASDNLNDTTLAKPLDTVTISFTSSEALIADPTATIDGDAVLVTNTGGNNYTAVRVMQPGDTETAVPFAIEFTDANGNPGISVTAITAGSDVTFDESEPGFALVNPILALLQDGTTPSTVPVAMWYYYDSVGQFMEFTVESDEPLSEAYVCTKSIETDDPLTGLCANEGDFLANSISYNDSPGVNIYHFSIEIDTQLGSYPTQVNGYPMNFKLVDAAGNIGYSAGPQHAFTGIWNVNPYYDFPGLDNAGTTDWSLDIPDFTNVTNLSFTMNMGAGDLGSLVLDGPIDLTDNSVITNLSALGTSLLIGGGDGSGDAVLGMDASALTALNTPATMTALVPGIRPGIVLYADDGTTVLGYVPSSTGDGVTINNVGGSGDDITFTSFVGNVLTFSTTGFSLFGTDNTAPTVTTFNPLNAATGVGITAEPTITFSEPVDTGTFTYTLPTAVGLSVTWNGTDTVATIHHTTAFVYNTAYTLTVTAVSDKVGNAIVGTPSANFTTAAQILGGGGGYNPPADNTLPVASSISVAGGSAQTVSTTVVLALSATNSAQMMISNSSDFSGAVWETYATSKTWTLTDNFGAKTVYAKFKNTAGSISAVISDVIDYVATVTIPETELVNLVLTDPVPAPALPPQVTIGTLVKLATSGSVYFIDQDNRRHAFPNEAVYFSYYPDFSGIQTISGAIMAEIPLGSNVTMRPGTYLVKIQSDPKVYAVAPYGVLKGIGSEAIAASLYGANWGTRIVDVEPTFFINYQIGSAITTATLPTGSVFSYQGDSKVYYVDGGNKRYVSSDVFISNKIQNKFVIRNLATSNTYPDGVDLPSQGMEVIMTLR